MSTPHSGSADDVPSGHVHLVLVRNPRFYLQIPLNTISSLCLKPRKYLAFLGWCVLGDEGWLTERGSTTPLNLDGDLDDRGLYYYDTHSGFGEGLDHAIDPEVIKQRSTVPSGSTATRSHFRDNLLERDSCCVFTGADAFSGNGMHIIPYSRGSEWFQLIIQNRPNYEEEVGNMTDINDIRNGAFVNTLIHPRFDLRHVVILKTPNRFLTTTDIPQRNRPFEPPEEVTYPPNMRYTLQWLTEPAPTVFYNAPTNIDAAFKRGTLKLKPSDLLLHYDYGAAAVKWWGHGKEVLETRPNIPRPTVPTPAPMGPTRAVHDRGSTLQKCDAARGMREGGAGSVAAGDRPGEIMDSKDDHVQWDEDDVMLFFWGNSPAAVERHRKKEQERSDYMEQWRQGVPTTSS